MSGYTVYVHETPDGKRYVGCTKQNPLRSTGKDIPTETVLFCITENGHELRNKALTIEGAEKYIDNLIKNGSDAKYDITAGITIYEGKDIIKKNHIVKECF